MAAAIEEVKGTPPNKRLKLATLFSKEAVCSLTFEMSAAA
jgi:hypothetical protein